MPSLPTSWILWLTLDLATLGVWMALAAAWWRDRPDGRTALVVPLVAWLVGSIAWVLLVQPEALPVSWVTLLQEGTTLDSARTLGRAEPHAGPNLHVLLALLTKGRVDLRALVAANLWLGLSAAAFTGLFAARIARSVWVGVALGLSLLLSPVTLHVFVSDQPTPLAAMILLATLLPWSTWRDVGRTRATRGLSLVGLFLLGLVLTGVRVELGGVVWTALALAGLHGLGVTRTIDRAMNGWRDGLASGSWTAWAAALSVGATLAWSVRQGWHLHSPAAFAPWPGWDTLRGLGRGAWLVLALHPLNASWTQVPGLLLGLLPVGAALLALVGFAVGLRHPLRTGGLALSVLILVRTYLAASHDALYEMVRYLGGLMPLVAILAAVGWHAMGQRERLRAVRPAVALLLLLPPQTWLAARTVPWPGGPDALPWPGRLDRNLQLEGRLLVTLAEAHPRCALVTRTARWTDEPFTLPPGTDPESPIVLGPGVLSYPRPREAADLLLFHVPPHAIFQGDTRLSQVLSRAPCALYYEGLDCNGDAAPACAADLQGARPVHEVSRPSLPYNHPDYHPVATRDPLRLGFHDLAGTPLLERLTAPAAAR